MMDWEGTWKGREGKGLGLGLRQRLRLVSLWEINDGALGWPGWDDA